MSSSAFFFAPLKSPYSSAGTLEKTKKETEIRHDILRRTAAEAVKDCRLGRKVGNCGIYIGLLEVPSNTVGGLNIYALFSETADFVGRSGHAVMSYEDASNEVAALKRFKTDIGAYFRNSNEIFAALSSGYFVSYARHTEDPKNKGQKKDVYVPYTGQAFIPPITILNGMAFYSCNGISVSEKVREENLFDLKNVGDFIGTYPEETKSNNVPYGSSSAPFNQRPDDRYYSNFLTGECGADHVTSGKRYRLVSAKALFI